MGNPYVDFMATKWIRAGWTRHGFHNTILLTCCSCIVVFSHYGVVVLLVIRLFALFFSLNINVGVVLSHVICFAFSPSPDGKKNT